MEKKNYLFTLLLLFLMGYSATAQSWWSAATEADAARMGGEQLIKPNRSFLVDIDLETLKDKLANAPRWFTPEANDGGVELSLPMPDGSLRTFLVVEAPVMSEALAAKFPGMRSFAGKSREDGTAYLRFGYTHKGFHAMILSGQHSTVFIDVYSTGQNRFHQSYYKSDYPGIPGNDFICHVEEAAEAAIADDVHPEGLILGDCQLRDYRLALACTGEYAQFHGGTIPDVMAEFNVAMTRVNGVYETDFTVHMELIDENDQLIFLDGSTDPYTNNSGGTMLGENQNTIDEIIGFNNYDVGHVFSTGGGGIASLNAPCNSNKARGVTGLSSPINDPFYIDYVAHELGHQYGANHTQNNDCNRVGATAMEPGSASTIMGYAGICAPNVQNNSDDHFHAISIQEITQNIEFGSGGNCPTTINTGNIGPTVTTESSTYVLPVSTPFFLTAIASDEDGDELTYCWEQMDNEIASMPPQTTNTGGPAFRSNSPIPSPTRYFPDLPAVINNNNPTWEVLPSVSREMDFRCTVRDNVIGGGCTEFTNVSLTFSADAGPFELLAPNTSVNWIVGEAETVSWDVANTDAAPVSCSEVDILLSVDGGFTYPITLAENVPNDGSAEIIVPLELTEQARVQVVCSDNIFYDISNEDFTIELPPTPSFLLTAEPEMITLCSDADASFEFSTISIAGFDESLNFSVSGLPEGAAVSFSDNSVATGETVVMEVSNLENTPSGTYILDVEVGSESVTKILSVTLELYNGVPEAAVLSNPVSGSQMLTLDTTLSWDASPFTEEYFIEIATSPAFGNSVVESATLGATTYQPELLEELTVYYWRVTAINLCGNSVPSELFSFQTLRNDCQRFTNEEPGLTIPGSGTGIFSSSFEVTEDLVITGLRFSMDMEHSWVGDLTALLRSPSSTSILLFDQPGVPGSTFGCGEDNLLVTFDDEAENTAEDFENSCEDNSEYAIEGTFQPIDALGVFNGESSAGQWTLDIADAFDQDGGTLISWSLDVCVEPTMVGAIEQVNNLPLEVFSGRGDTITTALLAHQKAGVTTSELSYRITALPANGLLLRLPGSDTLSIGDTFTQADVDMEALFYEHDGSMATTDFFRFDLSDPEGSWLSNQVFNILVVEPAPLTATVEVISPILCNEGSDGSIQVFPAGGIPPYQYSTDGMLFQPDPIFDNLPEGTYTITLIDDDGVQFELNPLTLTAPTAVTGTATALNSAITVDAMGGTPPYTYSLDGENYQGSNSFSGLDNGMYLVQIQDANACTGSVMVEVNSILSAAITTVDATCSDAMDGSILVGELNGGTTPYTYQLGEGSQQSDALFSGLEPGLYNLNITDANGNTLALEVEVASPAPLVLNVMTPSNGLILMAEGGTPPYQYSIDGGQTFSGDTEYTGLEESDYELFVQDANGCTFESIATVSFIGMASVDITNASCAAAADGSITILSVDGGTGPYTYSLNDGPAQSDATYLGLTAGLYDLFITDSEGNTLLMEGLLVTEPDPLVAEALVSGSTLTLSGMGGTPPYTYSLDEGNTFTDVTEYTALENGDYEVIVQDANGCMAMATATVNNIVTAEVELNNISCTGNGDGSILVVSIEGGVMPYTYTLNGETTQSDPLFEGLEAGTYELLVADENGNALLLQGLQIAEPEVLLLNAQVSGNDLTLEGQGGTAPYQYSIDGGASYSSTSAYESLPNGTYQLAIQDANGCIALDIVSINPLSSAQVAVDEVSCAGGEDGAIEVLAIMGGVAPFEFVLNGGPAQGEPVFSGLPAGTYELQITDAEGVSITISGIPVFEPALLELDVDVTGNIISLEGQGGNPPYEYSIDGGQAFSTDAIYENLPNGTYSVVVQDGNGCLFATDVIINIIVDVQAEVTNISCFGADDGSIEVTEIAGGTTPYSFQLDEGDEQSEGLFENLSSGVYTLTVGDANGNEFILEGLLIVTPSPVLFTSTVMAQQFLMWR
jgi:subtilisin-like proprotein convertase family protein